MMLDVNDGQEQLTDMANNLLIEVLSTMAEQERLTIPSRQAEDIVASKLRGKHLGRSTIKIPDNINIIYADWKTCKITADKAMQTLALKRTTFYKLVKVLNKGFNIKFLMVTLLYFFFAELDYKYKIIIIE